MKALLDRIHARVGDLWWYSLMIFVACRSGDAIQAFIGLWLVPKYVGPNELGAVLPLQQLSTLFTVPLAVISVVFSKYVNTYATHGEYGKVKCFIRDVLAASALVFIVCIGAAYWLIPHFYERLNVAAGSLTILILLSGFIGNISNLFNAALQGLKMFKTMTVQNLISAPIRLVTLLVAMPIRALSGYILGQTTPPASCSLLAALSLRKTLRDVRLDTSWRKDLPKIWSFLWPVAIYTGANAIFGSIGSTVYRQRLPEIESAAYYVITRFAEIAGFVGASISVILFPLASEAHESGRENPKLLIHSVVGTVLTTGVLMSVFALTSRHLFSLNEIWRTYADLAHMLPWITLTVGTGMINGAVTTYEMAHRRFGVTVFLTVFNLLWTIFIVSFTGYEFYRGILPDGVIDWMASLHLATLSRITAASIVSALIQFAFVFFIEVRNISRALQLQRIK